MLPFGKSGKTYIDQVTYLLNEWLHDSPLTNISVKKMVMVMPQLLQKPSKIQKTDGAVGSRGFEKAIQ